VFISVAGFSAEDFFTQLIYLQRHYRPAAVEVNISSPTYRGLWRDLPRLVDVDLPIFIKIGPGINMPLVFKAARRMGWGLVVTNTFPVEDRRISVGRGGLSGLLVYKYGVRMLGRIRGLVGPDTPIIYSGGLFTCSQLREVLKLANAAEVLTSILYFTPFVLKLLNQCPDIV
jgi:dihydroorotate dehydrogenase (fumarate)